MTPLGFDSRTNSAAMDSPDTLLLQFIDDEASALSRAGQGAFWPDNHHRITPLIGRAGKLLSEPQLGEFYFHLIRLNQFPSLKNDSDFDVLCAAYHRVLPLLSAGYPRCLLHRLKGLLLFGFDDLGALPAEPRITLAQFGEYLALWRYLDSFWHIPGLLKKKSKFHELGANTAFAERVQKAILQTPLAEELGNGLSLWLWALVFLSLHAGENGSLVVRKLAGEKLSPAQCGPMLETLHRLVDAADRPDLTRLVDDARGMQRN